MNSAHQQSSTYVPKPDEQLLQEKGVGTSTDALWRFLKTPKLPPYKIPVETWLKKFDVHPNKSKASLTSIKRLKFRAVDDGNWPKWHSMRLWRDGNRRSPAFVRDVTEALKRDHQTSAPRVIKAAIRLLVHRKPDALPEELLSMAPSIIKVDDRLEHALSESLAKLAIRGGKPHPAFTEGTKSTDPIIRAFAVRALIRAGGMKSDVARRLFEKEAAPGRWQIAMGLIDVKAKDAVETLIDLIPDLSGEKAKYLAKLLHHVAGNGPNPTLGGDKESRLKAQKAWLTWWKDHSEKITSAQISHGITVAYNDTHVVELDLNGQFLSQLEIVPALRTGPSYAVKLPSGKVLVSESETMYDNRHRVFEMSETGAILWKHEIGRPRTFEPLTDGRLLVCSRHRLYVVNRDGKATLLRRDPMRGVLHGAQKAGWGIRSGGIRT